MPKISVGTYVPSSNFGNSTDEIRNPNSIWRNTVRVRPQEYAVMKFIGDGGDLSRYHNIPGISANGIRFTKYEYCNRLNISESGNPVVGDPCPHCTSADEAIANTTERFLSWVFHYGTFHVEQNPRLDREGQQPWDEVRRGQKVFFRETIRKPQLFQASFTLYKNLEAKRELMDSLTERNFDYGCMKVQDRTTYSLDYSDTQLYNDFSNEIASIQQDLPDIEMIAAKLITEVDLPQFSDTQGEYTMTSDEVQQQAKSDNDAFENMQGGQ